MVNRVGYRRLSPSGGTTYLVLPEAFRREVCKGHDAKAAEKLLVGEGWIKPGVDGRANKNIRVGDAHIRLYEFISSKWEADEA